MTERTYWLIRGYDSTKQIFEKRLSTGEITNLQLETLLMVLRAKAGLNYDEIVGSFVKKGTRRFNTLLAVQHDVPHATLTCGSNPYFVAIRKKESELPK